MTFTAKPNNTQHPRLHRGATIQNTAVEENDLHGLAYHKCNLCSQPIKVNLNMIVWADHYGYELTDSFHYLFDVSYFCF